MAKVIGYANGEPVLDETKETAPPETTEPNIRPERFEWKEGDLVFDNTESDEDI